MLALILISMAATTFYTTSASQRLQQQVESTTLSAGAAEMGVERVHDELKEKVSDVWKDFKECLDVTLNQTGKCKPIY